MPSNEVNIWLEGKVLIEQDETGWYTAYCCEPDCGVKTSSPVHYDIDTWIDAHNRESHPD